MNGRVFNALAFDQLAAVLATLGRAERLPSERSHDRQEPRETSEARWIRQP